MTVPERPPRLPSPPGIRNRIGLEKKVGGGGESRRREMEFTRRRSTAAGIGQRLRQYWPSLECHWCSFSAGGGAEMSRYVCSQVQHRQVELPSYPEGTARQRSEKNREEKCRYYYGTR